jgi:UDP-N-acetylglucosamine 1-carboxyvinyltransferase
VGELKKMGAQIQVDGKTAIIEGVNFLTGAPLNACDLRAGAAMVIAGMSAQGTTTIEEVHYIERGYEDFVGKLQSLGASIEIVNEPDEPHKVATIVS